MKVEWREKFLNGIVDFWSRPAVDDTEKQTGEDFLIEVHERGFYRIDDVREFVRPLAQWGHHHFTRDLAPRKR